MVTLKTNREYSIMEVKSKLKDIIVEHITGDRKSIKNDSSFNNDLGFDSLDIVELIMACEEEFQIEIFDEDIKDFDSFGRACKYIENKINGE